MADFDIVEGDGAVPVYDCHVILTLPVEGRGYAARAAALPGVTAEAATERDVLRRIVDLFKHRLIAHRDAGEAIPWAETAEVVAAGEVERWIPVHL